jgi:hypothetical protein
MVPRSGITVGLDSIFKANTKVLLMNDVLCDDDYVRLFGGWAKGP